VADGGTTPDLAVQAVAGMGGRANRSSRAGEQWRRGGGIRPRSEKETGKERKIKPFFITSGIG
jgi:hypothetical protein